MALSMPTDALDKNQIRGALVSARLFADALDSPPLRYGGLGTMPIEAALQSLIDDGAARPSWTPWLTRWRIADAILRSLDEQKQAAPEMRARLEALRKTVGNDYVNRANLDKAFANGQDKPALTGDRVRGVRKWDTVVTKDGKDTVITSFVQIRGDEELYRRLLRMADPRNWAANSIFWYRSERLDQSSEPVVDDPWWSGRLSEVVASISIYSAILHICYGPDRAANVPPSIVEPAHTIVRYWLDSTPDNIEVDEGYIAISPPDDSEWITGIVQKRVDFADNPFGGPSVADLIAPSYLGSWLRVQQDLWIGHVTGQAFPGPAT